MPKPLPQIDFPDDDYAFGEQQSDGSLILVKSCTDCAALRKEPDYTEDSFERPEKHLCGDLDNRIIARYVDWNDKPNPVPDWCPRRPENQEKPMSERTHPYTEPIPRDEEEPLEKAEDEEDEEYAAYYADLLAGTNRTERFTIEADDENDDPEAEAKIRAKDGETFIKVEKCKPRRYKAMVEVTKLYRVVIGGEGYANIDCFDEAKAEIEDQIAQGADAKWQDCHFDKSQLLSLKEG